MESKNEPLDKLQYSVSLREKGLSKNEIIQDMKKIGFTESEIEFYVTKSDELHLNQLINNKPSKPQEKSNRILKTVCLILSLILLIAMFYGYFSVGLIGLILLLSLIRFASFR